MNIVICDDDKNYCEIIGEKIKRTMKSSFDFDADLFYFNSLDALSNYLKSETADIIFLDIMVNSVNSVDWAVTNLKKYGSRTVFMTFFPNEAYNLFETGCAYYLIKGKFTDEQLLNSIKRVLNNKSNNDPDVAIVKYSSKSMSVNYKDITYIESYNNNIILHFFDGKSTLLYTTLKSFLKTLPSYFIQCHKSFIVNMHSITSVLPYEFSVSSGDKIPIPQKKYKQMVARYEEFINTLI